MASPATRSAGAGASDASYGAQIWYTPGNITGSENNDAVSYSSIPSAISRYLNASSFGFTIPAGVTIDGIIVEIERAANKDTGGNYVVDNRVRIVKGGVVGTTDKADTSTHWPTADTYKSYGAADDLWGETWTYSDINASNFGVVLASNNFTSDGSTEAHVDHIRITVHYSTAAAAFTQSIVIM